MAEKTLKQSDMLAGAVREIAKAIREDQKVKESHSRIDQETENRRQIAQNIMAWANLVFVGLVIGQAFSDSFDITIGVIGGAIFVGAYFLAQQVMKGGDR